MNKRITDMLFLPYPGSPFTVHVTYNYGQKPKNLIPLTPISSITIPFPTQSTTPSSQNDQRLRAVFNREQIAALEEAFRRNNFLPKERRCELARRIGLEEKQVKDWFQNRRVKAKRNQQILTHNEAGTENEVVDQNYAANSMGEPRRMREEKEDVINQIVMFLEGSADININRIAMPPLNVLLPQMPRTIQTCLCTDDLDDLLDVLKKETRETRETQTSPISQLKRRKTDDHEDVPPPPQKKKRIEIPDQSRFYPQHLH
ncbi:PREDICTED: homeobox protein abdominal-A homolog [Rhagoletis zephyria]|uniref:homeobox protein abdominal-A homolog n=1 Tax=Rhagoletis zephyria TaxID=28612 RepID=UPI0008119F02|nr:PREDICTED: homeobox protein abdominal-A homolog [Rhagoletis zephyria]